VEGRVGSNVVGIREWEVGRVGEGVGMGGGTGGVCVEVGRMVGSGRR